jgi:hypothetical protein
MRGPTLSITQTIKPDGTWESFVPGASSPGPRYVGTVRVDGGKYRWKSDTTDLTGTLTLHEGDGRRVLMGASDNGNITSEATPAK